MQYELNKLYKLDYRQATKCFPDNYFGTGIYDFPYGINESKKSARRRRDKHSYSARQQNGKVLKINRSTYVSGDWDNATPAVEVINEAKRIVENYLFFGANYIADKLGVAKAPFKTPRRNEIDFFLEQYPKGWIAWDKCNGINDFSDYELIFTSFDFKSYILPYMWNGMMQGKSIKYGQVQQGDKRLNEKRQHPTHKPTLLIRYLLQKYGKSPIVDLSFGAGSIPLSCVMEGFDFFACEINDKYIDVAKQRLESYRMQSQNIIPFPFFTKKNLIEND